MIRLRFKGNRCGRVCYLIHGGSIKITSLFYSCLFLILWTAADVWYFPKWQLPKSAICSAQPQLQLAAPHGPNLTFGKLQLGKLHFWEVAIGKVPNTAESNSVVLNSQWLDLLWTVILIQALHILSTNLRLSVCTALPTLDGKDDMKVFKFDFR